MNILKGLNYVHTQVVMIVTDVSVNIQLNV